MVAASREEGTIQGFAAELLSGVLDFGGREVASVMVPRDEICWIGATATAAEAEAVVLDQGHSRLPVVGAAASTTCSGSCTPRTCCSSIRRCSTGRCRRGCCGGCSWCRASGRSRICCSPCVGHGCTSRSVTEPDGRTAGIVTLDDLLEELVGDITDEPDQQ